MRTSFGLCQFLVKIVSITCYRYCWWAGGSLGNLAGGGRMVSYGGMVGCNGRVVYVWCRMAKQDRRGGEERIGGEGRGEIAD